MTRYLNYFIKEGLLWLTVFKVSVCGHLILCCGACDGQNSRVKIAEDYVYYFIAAGSRDKQERAGLPAAPQRHTPDLTSFNRASPPPRCHSLLIAA